VSTIESSFRLAAGGVAIGLLATAACVTAAAIPAWAAAGTDPVRVIRSE